MKKGISFVFVLVFAFGLAPAAWAVADRGAYTIEEYDIQIELDKDSSMRVIEEITVNFSEYRHGIFREIPYSYENGQGFRYNLRLSDFAVTDGSGQARQFQRSTESGNIILKIGDPNREVVGEQVYVIEYTAERGIRFFEEWSELYWNIIGTGWQTEIAGASGRLFLPEPLDLGGDDMRCFTGGYGEQGADCRIRQASETEVAFAAQNQLAPGEGLTVAVRFPAGDLDEPAQGGGSQVPVSGGYLERPDTTDRAGWFLADNWAIVIPVIVLVFMFWLWRRYGKDPEPGKTAIRQYEPPDDLGPGEVGYLINKKYGPDMVSADIVNLAVKGYLKIKEREDSFGSIARLVMIPVFLFLVIGFISVVLVRIAGSNSLLFSLVSFLILGVIVWRLKKQGRLSFKSYDYELVKMENPAGRPLKAHEQALLDGLFGDKKNVKLSELKKEKFYKEVKKVQEKLKKQIAEKGYFEKALVNRRVIYFISAFIAMFLLLMAGGIAGRTDLIVAVILSCFIVAVFAVFMDKRTRKGADAYHYALGFKEYINVAETDRVKFQEKENIFLEYLPYAMIFGVADKWAQAFEGVLTEPPDWYEGHAGAGFHPAVFAGTLNSSFSRATQAAAATPSSNSSSSGFSSGGFSGGGFSGGGGGSW